MLPLLPSCQRPMSPLQILQFFRGVSRGWGNQSTRPAFTCDLQGSSCCSFRVTFVLNFILLYIPAVAALEHNEIKVVVLFTMC